MPINKGAAPSKEWAQWEREHQAAVEALRKAEEGYQRVIAGSAFLSAGEDPSPVEVQHDALNRLEEARRHLDEVRQARPERPG
jgi:hypothetical protein